MLSLMKVGILVITIRIFLSILYDHITCGYSLEISSMLPMSTFIFIEMSKIICRLLQKNHPN